MIRRLGRIAAGVTRIAFGLPLEVCHELWIAGDNLWVWMICEWEAAQKGRWPRG